METPEYWDILSEEDRTQYQKMKQDFSSGVMKRVRNSRAETFDEILEVIKKFCVKNDDNDWKRYLVCGVCWMDSAIAINTRQLRLLVCKCKSSINGSLQKMGYTTNMAHSESWKILFPKIPLLKDHFPELRKWTIRYKPSEADAMKRETSVAKNKVDLPIQQANDDKSIGSSPNVNQTSEESSPQEERTVPPLLSVPLKFRQKMMRLQHAIST